MLKTFSLACLGLLCSGVLGCAADVAPTDTGDHGPALAEQIAEGQRFVVQLSPDVTAESVIPAILAAGHVQLAAACETSPGASVRIVHALASGAFTDVPCSRILGGESTRHTSGALTSGEQVGEARQALSPFSLVCGALMLGASLAWNWPYGQSGCNTPGAENPDACKAVTVFGGGALSLLCALI